MKIRLMNKIPRKIPASIVVAYLEKCGFSTEIASCDHTENALLAVPNVSA